MDKPKLIVILGPTATGKSDMGVLLAQQFGGEVVSADSRQVYKGLDIGSGKITKREMHGVPHHLLDVTSPRKRYAVSNYQQDGVRALSSIINKNKLPIIVGGTGLYIDALVYGTVFPHVPPNVILRKKLEGKSTASLFALLQKKDPKRAKTIDSKNPRRLIRALEIVKALGTVPLLTKKKPLYNTLFIGLNLPPEKLRNKIRVRLEKRLKQGMIAEVRTLHTQGVSWKRLDELGLEYRFVARHLRGLITKKEMLATLEKEIIQYSKRQMTWFKTNKKITWFSPACAEASAGRPTEIKKIKREVTAFLKK